MPTPRQIRIVDEQQSTVTLEVVEPRTLAKETADLLAIGNEISDETLHLVTDCGAFRIVILTSQGEVMLGPACETAMKAVSDCVNDVLRWAQEDEQPLKADRSKAN